MWRPHAPVKYRVKKAGEVVDIGRSGALYKMMCCDCGLVHLIKIKITKGRLSWQVWRHNRATAAARTARKRRASHAGSEATASVRRPTRAKKGTR